MMTIREERPADVDAVRAVNERAFGRAVEGSIVDALRANGGVLLSLVAAIDDRVVGHALFSPVQIGDLTGAGLGPMAVIPEHQRRGVGGRLIEEGLRRLRESGCPFVVVLGHPDYYPRFGFTPARAYGITCQWDVPDPVFMITVLNPNRMAGVAGPARYRDEFGVEGRGAGPS